MNEKELLRLVPPVLRARDFHLYTEGAGRLLDLWLEGGAAVLGHTPPAQLHELKNAAGRGLFSALPHPQEKRFAKALSLLFPGRLIRVYASPLPLINSLLTPGPDDIEKTGIWRPFFEKENPLAIPEYAPPVLIPVLPGQLRIPSGELGLPASAGSIPFVLAIDPVFAEAHPLPPSDLLSPTLLSIAVRGVYDLIAATPLRANLRYQKIDAALKKTSFWHRKGIYLFPEPSALALNPANWEKLFRRFLDGGFLIPPGLDFPIILPGLMSPGEEAKLADLLE
jgi:hypothetical protein